jgi:SAM-dependent methyltransferase
MTNFNLYSKYYDLFYECKDYSKETEHVYNKLKLEAPLILDLGCGSGGHAKEIVKLGASVFGIDLSAQMVEIANSKLIDNFYAMQGNICSFSLNRKFDAATSLFHVISYLNTDKEIIDTFLNVSRHLNPGSPFIFDFWFSPAVYHLGFETRIKKFENEIISATRKSSSELDISKNLAKVKFKIHVKDKSSNNSELIEEEHSMRFFSIPEIEHFATATGFMVVEFFEMITNKKPSVDTWAITAKLVKKY